MKAACWALALMLASVVIPVWAKAIPAPDYTARRLGSQQEVSLASLRGRVVLLNTWATWCIPCRRELPAFEKLYREYRDRGLTVVGVNIDQGQADAVVKRYVAGLGISFPIWRDRHNQFAKTFRVLGAPETFLINREGMIVHHWRGRMDPYARENLELIEAALGAPADEAGPSARPQASTAERGRRIAEQRECLTCHSSDGTRGMGPSWEAGTKVKLSDGRTAPRDRAYLTRAIVEPDAEIVAGYPKGLMAGAIPGSELTERQVEALVRHILSLSGGSGD